MKPHLRHNRPRFYSLSNRMTQLNVNSRVNASNVDVSEDISLSSMKRVLLRMPIARREKFCKRYLTHGGKNSVQDTSCTAGKFSLQIAYPQREQFYRRRIIHGRKNRAEDAKL